MPNSKLDMTINFVGISAHAQLKVLYATEFASYFVGISSLTRFLCEAWILPNPNNNQNVKLSSLCRIQIIIKIWILPNGIIYVKLVTVEYGGNGVPCSRTMSFA